VADEAHAIFQLDMRADQTIGPDLDAIADTRAVGDARRRINCHLLLDQPGADRSQSRRHTRKCRLPRNVVDRGGSVKAITESAASTSSKVRCWVDPADLLLILTTLRVIRKTQRVLPAIKGFCSSVRFGQEGDCDQVQARLCIS
jgi:hypothetical protein